MAAATEDYGDDYDDYYDDDERGASGFVILIVGLLIVAVFCLIVIFAYQRGMAAGESRAGEVPLVTAEAGPVKTERELDLPGATRPEVDATLAGNAPAEVLVDARDGADPLEDFSQTVSAADQTAAATVDEPAAQPATTTTPPADNSDIIVSRNDVATTPTRPEPQPEPVATTPQPAATGGSAISGSHVVQVGAFGSDAEANGYFDSMAGKFPGLISGKQPDVQRADLGDRGVFYRLRVGPFASYDAATTYCGQLKAGGQDCLVRAVD